jgi:hypothetical protein
MSDIFDEINLNFDSKNFDSNIFDSNTYYNIPVPPSSPNMDMSHSKFDLFMGISLTTTSKDIQLYRRPSHKSHDANTVWRQAYLPDFATLHNIEIQLVEWALTNATLVVKDKKIMSITWKNVNNISCSSNWSTFLKWMICVCQPLGR